MNQLPRPITSLFAVDEERRPLGILHIHDCLQSGHRMKGPLQSAVALRMRSAGGGCDSMTAAVTVASFSAPNGHSRRWRSRCCCWWRCGPSSNSVFQHVRFGAARIDLSEARRLRMVNPRYSGIDRESRPYVLTADAATQVPRSDDLVTLDGPKADLTTKSGNWVEISGDTGTYQTAAAAARPLWQCRALSGSRQRVPHR